MTLVFGGSLVVQLLIGRINLQKLLPIGSFVRVSLGTLSYPYRLET